jgi:hypothetical protein
MPKASKGRSRSSRSALVFESTNYLWIAASALLIAVGFIAMYLDGQFLGTVALTVSPILIVAGYGALIYGILRRPTDAPAVDEEDSS